MASQRSQPAAKPSSEPPVSPPYYIATAPLYIDGQFTRAHNPGSHVLPEHVEQYGWHDKVRAPDGYTDPIPDQSSTDEPDTANDGQATSEGKDA